MVNDVHLERLTPILDSVASDEVAHASVCIRDRPVIYVKVAWTEIAVYLKRLRLPAHGRKHILMELEGSPIAFIEKRHPMPNTHPATSVRRQFRGDVDGIRPNLEGSSLVIRQIQQIQRTNWAIWRRDRFADRIALCSTPKRAQGASREGLQGRDEGKTPFPRHQPPRDTV